MIRLRIMMYGGAFRDTASKLVDINDQHVLYPYTTQATNRPNRHELFFSNSGGLVRFH